MASNFVQPGHELLLTAPAGGVTSGTPVIIGGFFVIPTTTTTVGLTFIGTINGAWTLPKTSGETWTEGQAAFWDVTNAKISTDPTVGQLPVGAVCLAAASADTTGLIRLNGLNLSGRMYNVRKRLAVATVNAGATVLPVLTGLKYRLVAASAIAVGGAAGAVTTVDILGTVSSSRKLVAFAQASLVQSAVLKDGGAGAAVLADGASYTANDVSTAITVGITGSAITTATSIDFSITYSLE